VVATDGRDCDEFGAGLGGGGHVRFFERGLDGVECGDLSLLEGDAETGRCVVADDRQIVDHQYPGVGCTSADPLHDLDESRSGGVDVLRRRRGNAVGELGRHHRGERLIAVDVTPCRIEHRPGIAEVVAARGDGDEIRRLRQKA
jgi:hypothetical protein